ncbi:glycoside hydrolase family 47 protein [Rhodotorula paludigena]|uniref:glycoside hydrolase family 47 protein n=1 Tax=Rhodotorula paludigena TaxID=86838 RepID=UPI0031763E7E
MPKRKDAQQPQPRRTEPARPAPARPPAAQPSGPHKPSYWRLAFIFLRIAVCAGALYVLYQKLHGPAPVTDEADDPERVTFEPIERDEHRRQAILDAFKHSYEAYERDAFGFDDYHPISHKGSNMSPAGPVGYFVIDSLDSLLLTGLKDEYQRARDWITIRVLGGLLSAYHLSGEKDQMLLDKAVDLADRLLPAFETESGIPMSFANLAKRTGILDHDNRGLTSVAEAGTLQLEFKYLSQLTGNPIYWQKVEKVMEVIRAQPHKDGLVPIFMRSDTGDFVFSDIRLGSRGDSYYEYLYKQFVQTNGTEPVYRDMHVQAMDGIKRHLLKRSATRDLVYTSELLPRRNPVTGGFEMADTPKQDHLVCFLGASLLLGATDSNRLPVPPDESLFTDAQLDDWYAGKALIKTCVDTYTSSKTGLAPEIVNFYTSPAEARRNHREWFINSRKLTHPDPPIDARNILRPETAESLFVAYRVTGDPIYRTWGWTIFQAFEKHCRLPEGGYASVRDVDQVPVEHEDRMETFWISETLKYLFLLYSEKEVIPLQDYTLNTEAHPLPRFQPTVAV